MDIKFCKTTLGEEEKKAICDVIDGGWVVMGKKTQEFEQQFAEYVGAKHAVFVDSCTSALDLSLKYLLYKKIWNKKYPVKVPSLTFTASAEVIVNNGMKPQFVDVQRDNFVANKVVSGQAILVHLTGNQAEDFVKDLPIIEDSAHRIEREQCKDNPNLVCFSFYATKNMTTVQGGIIAVNDEEIARWLKKARDHGVSKGTTERYKDGAWAYDVEFIGWREKSDDLHAAIGIEQLKKLPAMDNERKRIIALYNELLGLNRTGLHLYPVLVLNRAEFINKLKEKGIQCSVHFLPLHQMTGYKKYYKQIPLQMTDWLGEHLVSLPLYPQLTNEEVKYIVDTVLETKLLIHE